MFLSPFFSRDFEGFGKILRSLFTCWWSLLFYRRRVRKEHQAETVFQELELEPYLSAVVIGPGPHRVSRALRARNPGRVRKESRKSPPGVGSPPQSGKSAPRSLQRVLTPFGLFWVSGAHSFRTVGSRISRLFPDSFRTLLGLPARRARETLCGAGPITILLNCILTCCYLLDRLQESFRALRVRNPQKVEEGSLGPLDPKAKQSF